MHSIALSHFFSLLTYFPFTYLISGKSVVCDCWKRDVVKLTSGFIKKNTTPVKTRSLKKFR